MLRRWWLRLALTLAVGCSTGGAPEDGDAGADDAGEDADSSRDGSADSRPDGLDGDAPAPQDGSSGDGDAQDGDVPDGSVAGSEYRFPPPPPGDRELRVVQIPAEGLDRGVGSRHVIDFERDDGYLLLVPPDEPITGMVDIETNARTVVIHGAEFLPTRIAFDEPLGPRGNLTVGKVLDIFTTGANFPEIYVLRCLFRTTDDEGRVVWNAGDPINVGGEQSEDSRRWPLVHVEGCWFDDLFGYSEPVIGHTDIIKVESGPVRGIRIARNRWGCSYQFFILFNRHNEEYGAFPGGTNELFDNQWYSIDAPAGWSARVGSNLYLSTSYSGHVAQGRYHPYLFLGVRGGGEDGHGTYVDMTGNSQDDDLGDLMSPPEGYGFELVGDDLVGVSGQPPEERNDDQDWGQGIIHRGLHPRLGDPTTRDRPAMREETGRTHRVTSRSELEAIAR